MKKSDYLRASKRDWRQQTNLNVEVTILPPTFSSRCRVFLFLFAKLYFWLSTFWLIRHQKLLDFLTNVEPLLATFVWIFFLIYNNKCNVCWIAISSFSVESIKFKILSENISTPFSPKKRTNRNIIHKLLIAVTLVTEWYLQRKVSLLSQTKITLHLLI